MTLVVWRRDAVTVLLLVYGFFQHQRGGSGLLMCMFQLLKYGILSANACPIFYTLLPFGMAAHTAPVFAIAYY